MRILRIALLFICSVASALLVLSESSYAKATSDVSECSTVDVRDNMNPQLKEHFSTPSDQGGVGWCYGYAASDILSQAIGTPISAVYTSSYYVTKIGALGKFARSLFYGEKGGATGGFIGTAIEEMQELGAACTTKGAPFMGSFEYELIPKYVSLGGTSYLIDLLTQVQRGTCDKYCNDKLVYNAKFYLPRLDLQEVKNYVLKNKTSKVETLLYSLLDANCGSDKVAVSPNIRVQTGIEQGQAMSGKNSAEFDVTKTLIYKLDKNLNRGKVVGLEYNSEYVNRILGGYHASTVVGRKVIGNQCYYQVRNSRGTSCNYVDGVICSPTDGTYWVARPLLKRMTSKLVWVD